MGALLAAALVAFSLPLSAAGPSGTSPDASIARLLPLPGFGVTWVMQGKPETFTPENLYQHINGEAELYLPYGFAALASAVYARAGSPKTAIAVDIYRMGSLLDAFGIYSNYRDPDAEPVLIGAEGFSTGSQLMFYQDRYFVQVSSSGEGEPEARSLVACARAIAAKLPGPPTRPRETEVLGAPGITPRTEKYVAVSVLGYEFFKKGLTAEGTIDGKKVKVFLILDPSANAAVRTLEQYTAYLAKSEVEPGVTRTARTVTLTARDPLYKGLVIRQSGRYLAGVANIDDYRKGAAFLDRLLSK